MADKSSIEEIWRKSLELNIRYFSAVTSLGASYYKDLATLFSNLQDSYAEPQTQTTPAPAVHAQPAQGTARPVQQAGVMVLEAEAGGQALGVFLVANNLGQEVSARVVASEFTDANGRSIQPSFTFDPEVITLAPSHQLLVRVTTEIDTALEPEVRYSGEFAIPELSDTRIPIVVRRRTKVDEPADDALAATEDISKKSKSSNKSKNSNSNNKKSD